MKNYGDARQDIKKLLQEHLKAIALKEGKGGGANEEILDRDISKTADDLISEFEDLVNLRGYSKFSRGVWQGVVASVLFVLGVAAVGGLVEALDYGRKQDPSNWIAGLFHHRADQNAAGPSPSPGSSLEQR